MSKNRPDPRFPLVESLNETESDIWMSIAEAAKYGNMSLTRIYSAIEKGLPSRTNPVSNIKEVPKDALERWFCPFKENAQYEDEKVANELSRQRMRIRHLHSRLDIFRGHIDDLQEMIEILKSQLEEAHKREGVSYKEKEKLLEIIANKEKK